MSLRENNSLFISKKEMLEYSPPENIRQIINIFIENDDDYYFNFCDLFDELLPNEFFQWALIYLPLTNADKDKIDEIFENKNSIQFKSKKVENSKYVSDSENVIGSDYIQSSYNVEESEQITSSRYIKNSNNVYGSRSVTHGHYIYDSSDIVDSTMIVSSDTVTGSLGIFNSTNIEYCQLINHCSELRNCFLCEDIYQAENRILCNKSCPDEAKYAILNEEVDEQTFKQSAAAIVMYLRKNYNAEIYGSFNYYYGIVRYLFDNEKGAYWLKNQVLPKWQHNMNAYYITYKFTMCEALLREEYK